MGLFGIGKKNQRNNGDSILSSPQQFYNECVVDFHKKAEEWGYAKKGLIVIPELGTIGEKTVMTFLKDNFFQVEFGRDPKMYYYVIMSISLQAGIVFSKKWHESFSELQSGYVEKILTEGPSDVAYDILANELDMDKKKFNGYSQKIYEKWLEIQEPYWKLKDPRDYIFSAMNAAFQLGVSMTLEKYGY